MTTVALEPAYRHCQDYVRQWDKDRWLATLFAPEAARPHLLALYAFSLEIARVREIVSDPMPGEMRFQWWRDTLAGIGHGDVRGHPVAAAVLDTVERFRLPIEALYDLIEARSFDLYDDPMPTVLDLEGYCGETSSALVQLAAIVLAGGRDPGTSDAAGHAGVAYAMTGLMRAFPFHAARAQVYIPAEILDRHGVVNADLFQGRDTPALRDALAEMRKLARAHLEATRERVGRLPTDVAPAFLPTALVRGYLDRMDQADYSPFTTLVDVPQWKKQWVLWTSARRARRGPPLGASNPRPDTQAAE